MTPQHCYSKNDGKHVSKNHAGQQQFIEGVISEMQILKFNYLQFTFIWILFKNTWRMWGNRKLLKRLGAMKVNKSDLFMGFGFQAIGNNWKGWVQWKSINQTHSWDWDLKQLSWWFWKLFKCPYNWILFKNNSIRLHVKRSERDGKGSCNENKTRCSHGMRI